MNVLLLDYLTWILIKTHSQNIIISLNSSSSSFFITLAQWLSAFLNFSLINQMRFGKSL